MTEPAFPYSRVEFWGGEQDETKVPGLTKREYAAIHIAAAITGGLAAASIDTTDNDIATISTASVRLAAAVLREAGDAIR